MSEKEKFISCGILLDLEGSDYAIRQYRINPILMRQTPPCMKAVTIDNVQLVIESSIIAANIIHNCTVELSGTFMYLAYYATAIWEY
jgi:hypothetical protein